MRILHARAHTHTHKGKDITVSKSLWLLLGRERNFVAGGKMGGDLTTVNCFNIVYHVRILPIQK